MLDRLMGVRVARKSNEVDAGYCPAKAIRSSREVTPETAKTLAVLFPPWRGGDRLYDVLATRLRQAGSAVLQYYLHPQILQPDVQVVLDSFNVIQQTAAADIQRLRERQGFERIHFIAASLGNVSLGLVSQVVDFDNATMVVPGSDLARCMWNGSRTQGLRESLVAQGETEESLAEKWAPLAPITAVRSFAGKDVHVVMSETDEIIPTDYQVEMAVALEEAGANFTVDSTNLGHTASVVKHCLVGQLSMS